MNIINPAIRFFGEREAYEQQQQLFALLDAQLTEKVHALRVEPVIDFEDDAITFNAVEAALEDGVFFILEDSPILPILLAPRTLNEIEMTLTYLIELGVLIEEYDPQEKESYIQLTRNTVAKPTLKPQDAVALMTAILEHVEVT